MVIKPPAIHIFANNGSHHIVTTIDPKAARFPVFAARKGCPVLVGVLPDSAGRAWFELPAPVTYNFGRIDETGVKTTPFTATEKPLAQPPGFGYIDRIDLK